jgi:hypothetical protein
MASSYSRKVSLVGKRSAVARRICLSQRARK